MESYRHRIVYDTGWTEVVKFLILSNVTIFAVQEIFGLQSLFR